MRALEASPADIVMAKQLSVSTCDCGSIHIRLHGTDGVVFAIAGLSVANVVSLMTTLANAVENVTEGPCSCAREAVH